MSRNRPIIGLTALTLAFLLTGRALAQANEPATPAEPAAPAENAGAPAASEPAAAAPSTEAPEATASAPAGVNLAPGMSPLEAEFADYLHYALMGQFDIADTHAKAILARPDVNPLDPKTAAELLALSEKYKNSVETLLVIINNTPISGNAQKILDLVRQAHRMARIEPERIIANIRLLGGTPVQQSVAIERLRESGEYAVPWMLHMLRQQKEQALHPFIIKALPLLGKKAVNPLAQALSIKDPGIRGIVAEALGRIGYPQALPYLARLAAESGTNDAVRKAASDAIKRIVVSDKAAKNAAPAELFRLLAEQYYANTESLRPDISEPKANVWFVRNDELVPVEVPREIYQYVMAMRAAQSSLALVPNQPEVVALWLASDINREAALGLDVTSEEAVATADASRPKDFPRSIYFARTFGPLYSELALARAIRDHNSDLALGVIAALNVTAGPAVMVEPAGPEGASLAAALRFPDLLVRIRAALALARAMPQKPFRDADQVVPVLASAVQLTGKKNYLLVEPDTTLRERLQQDLSANATVVAADSFNAAMDQARRKLTHLDGVFIASDIDRPTVVEAVRTLEQDARFGLTPVVLLVKPNDNVKADRAAEVDPRIGRVFFVADGAGAEAKLAEQLVERNKQAAPKFGHEELTPEQSLALSLEAAGALRLIAVNRSPVFEPKAAESALTGALASPSEDLRIAAAGALALINSPAAQRAIAGVALGSDQTESMRKAAFAAMAESARRFGSLLDQPTTKKLLEVAVNEPNLALRTSASQAVGAMNLPGKPVAQIIIAQPD